jgi:hypothetical protein
VKELSCRRTARTGKQQVAGVVAAHGTGHGRRDANAVQTPLRITLTLIAALALARVRTKQPAAAEVAHAACRRATQQARSWQPLARTSAAGVDEHRATRASASNRASRRSVATERRRRSTSGERKSSPTEDCSNVQVRRLHAPLHTPPHVPRTCLSRA